MTNKNKKPAKPKHKGPKKPNHQNPSINNAHQAIESFLKKQYDFKHNLVTDRVEYREKGVPDYKVMTDMDDNSIHRKLKQNGYNINITNLRMLFRSDFVEKFDPFAAYFISLPEWDGKIDYIERLCGQVSTTNQEFWKDAFKRWIVACVGCLLQESVINQTVIVLSGKQGIGKTTWLENLVPDELKQYTFSGTINPDNKDMLSYLTECMLIHLDELDSLSNYNMGKVKQVITQSKIKYRKPYGYHNEDYQRRASFVASINSDQFLIDTTGSRRFLCFKAEEIKYHEKVDLKLVYSQALYLFKHGFKYWFDGSDLQKITSNNEAFQVKSLEEELLLLQYKPSIDKDNPKLFLTATEIAEVLSNEGNFQVNNTTVIRIGKLLAKNGFHRVKKNGVYTWALDLVEKQ